MAERVVDELETVEIEKQDCEFGGGLPLRCRSSARADLVKRGAEHASVRKAGQRIFGREASDMRLRLPPLGDVSEGLHETAVGQAAAAANLDDTAVLHL